MGDINQERPDLVKLGWTQEMWDARQGQDMMTKALSTDSSFAGQWNKGLRPNGAGFGQAWTPAAETFTNYDQAPADGERARVSGMLEQLQQQATTGGGAWEQTFKDATAKAGANAQALGQSTPGTGYQSQMRNIGNAQGAVAQRAVGEEEMLRNQSKLDAQASMGQALGTMGDQDIAQAGEVARTKRVTRGAQKQWTSNANKASVDAANSALGFMPGMSDGGAVPGEPEVFGDDEANDTVPAKLSPGEIVIPRSIAEGPDAPARAAEFVRALQAQKGGGDGDGVHFAEGGELLPKPTVEGGGKLNVEGPGTYGETRGRAAQLQPMLASRAQGAGPSVAPQMLQKSNDQNLAAALIAAQSGRGAPAGDATQILGAAGVGGAAAAGRQVGQEQGLGQRAALNFEADQRGREMQLASAQQEAGLQSRLMDLNMGLDDIARTRNFAGGAGQAATAFARTQSGGVKDGYGRNDSGYDVTRDPNAYNYGASEPDEWADPYAGKAFGGEITDEEDEKRRARDFIDSLRGGA